MTDNVDKTPIKSLLVKGKFLAPNVTILNALICEKNSDISKGTWQIAVRSCIFKPNVSCLDSISVTLKCSLVGGFDWFNGQETVCVPALQPLEQFLIIFAGKIPQEKFFQPIWFTVTHPRLDLSIYLETTAMKAKLDIDASILILLRRSQ